MGTLSERKGFHLVMEAMARLRKRWPTLRFAIVGGDGAEGAMAGELRQLAARLKIADRVVFAGPRKSEELASWYGAADLFVLASSHEGCPNVVLEALACGTPVVGTPVGNVPELLDSPEVGIVVERTADALAAGIDAALERGWDRDRVARPRRGPELGGGGARAGGGAAGGHRVRCAHRGGVARRAQRALRCRGGQAVKILYHHRTRAGDAQGIHIAEIQRAFRLRGHEVREVALVEAGAEAKADAEGGEARGLAGLASRAAAHMPAAVKEGLELAYNAVAYRRLSRAHAASSGRTSSTSATRPTPSPASPPPAATASPSCSRSTRRWPRRRPSTTASSSAASRGGSSAGSAPERT